jgi:hypothetical protein
MTPELRRYPRIPFDGTGQLSREGADGALPVTVRCLSCEGVGLELRADDTLVPGAVVALRFEVPEGPIALPGRVVWAAGRRAGVHLRLAEIDPASKKTFGAWIAPRTKEALARARQPGS